MCVCVCVCVCVHVCVCVCVCVYMYNVCACVCVCMGVICVYMNAKITTPGFVAAAIISLCKCTECVTAKITLY